MVIIIVAINNNNKKEVMKMVTEAEFMKALNFAVASSAKARMAADNVVAVANVDTSKISEGIQVVLTWALKIVGMLMEEINRNPALQARMVETGRIISENSTMIANNLVKTGILPALFEIANNMGFGLLFGKIIGF